MKKAEKERLLLSYAILLETPALKNEWQCCVPLVLLHEKLACILMRDRRAVQKFRCDVSDPGSLRHLVQVILGIIFDLNDLFRAGIIVGHRGLQAQ